MFQISSRKIIFRGIRNNIQCHLSLVLHAVYSKLRFRPLDVIGEMRHEKLLCFGMIFLTVQYFCWLFYFSYLTL